MDIKQLRNKVKRLRIAVFMLVLLLCAITAISYLFCLKIYDKYTTKYNEMYDKYNSLSQAYRNSSSISINKLREENQELELCIEFGSSVIDNMREIIKDLDSQIIEIGAINESYVNELNDLRSRKELLDKYEYAIFDELGNRTNLTYAQLKLGEDLMLEKGYDPDLMFGTIMVESGGNPLAVNPKSGAKGYGQFIDSTAKFVYTNLMGNDSYYPEVAKEGNTNIRMMASYYDYLYKKEGDTFSVIKEYSGNTTRAGACDYLRKINKFTNKVGVTIE